MADWDGEQRYASSRREVEKALRKLEANAGATRGAGPSASSASANGVVSSPSRNAQKRQRRRQRRRVAEDTADAPPADDGKRDDADEANAADDDGDDEEKRPTATDGSVESAGSALPEFKLSLSDSDEDAAAAATATAAQTTADGDRKTDRLSALARHFKQLKRGLVRGAADEAPLAPQPPKQPPQRQLRAGGPGQALAAADPHGRALEVKEEDFERLHALERRLRRIHRDIKEQRSNVFGLRQPFVAQRALPSLTPSPAPSPARPIDP